MTTPRELPIRSPLEPVLEEARGLANKDRSLEEAKAMVADSYGFLSWRQLEVFVEMPDEPRIDFDHLACVTYVWWDHPSRRKLAYDMLRQDPDLESRSLYSACTVGNVALVEQLLDDNPEVIDQRGGYFDWEPLLYACYSRIDLPNRSTSDVIRLLIDRGANPNAHYRWGGIYVFSALTGLLGEGERGPINQPPHEDCFELASLLLDAGADCNDSQALYNRMFQADNRTLELLLKYGLNKDHVCNWRATVGSELVENPEKTLDYQLQWAVKSNFTERVRILTAHGANVNQVLPNDGGSLAKISRLRGFNEVADNLESHGAEPYQLSDVEQFLNHCLNGEESQARSMLAIDESLIEKANKHDPDAMKDAAAGGNEVAIKLMYALGFAIHGAGAETPIHLAAHNGHLSLVKWLLANGADLHRRDPFYLGTPLSWAQASDKINVIEYLEQLNLGIFDLINADSPDRIDQLLTQDSDLLERPLREELANELKQHENAWQTPLAYAAVRGRVPIVQVLLKRGANSNLHDDEDTPLTDLCNEEIRSILAD